MNGVGRRGFESQLCHFQAVPLGQVMSPFAANTHLPWLLQDSKTSGVMKALCEPENSIRQSVIATVFQGRR